MATSQYPNINENQFAGLLQVATAAADAQERNASALGKRKRDDEAYIDHQLRTPAGEMHHTESAHGVPTLQSSAAVLFREPSEKSKKYSRPPLGKVFTDLELPPELFLQLQSAAKAFMLDPEHPERKSVVGQKKSNSNNDVAKLKLWNCVDQFLAERHDKTGELNSEFYFGRHAGANIPNQPPRSFVWPEHKDQVIKMCMPLFRKMVTNERQRLYASETRKQDPGKPEKGKKAGSSNEGLENGMAAVEDNGGHGMEQDTDKVDDVAQSQTNMFLARDSDMDQNQLKLHVNVVSRDADDHLRRLAPRMTIASEAAPNLVALLAEVHRYYDLSQHPKPDDTSNSPYPAIQVWLENGLMPVKDEGEWMVALLSTTTAEWMDGELRVLVEV